MEVLAYCPTFVAPAERFLLLFALSTGRLFMSLLRSLVALFDRPCNSLFTGVKVSCSLTTRWLRIAVVQ
jgi:hypothetical protein